MAITATRTISQLEDAQPFQDSDLIMICQNNGTGKYVSKRANLTRLRGKSAYELAVEAGFTGTFNDWIISLQAPSVKNIGDIDNTDFVVLVQNAWVAP